MRSKREIRRRSRKRRGRRRKIGFIKISGIIMKMRQIMNNGKARKKRSRMSRRKIQS